MASGRIISAAVKVDGKFQNPVPTGVGGFSMIFKILPLYLTNKEERVPIKPPGPFRTDAKIYATQPASGLRVTWFGHSSMLLEIGSVRLLIDPTLPLEEMPAIDAVLISHDHFDHLGKGTVQRLSKLKSFEKARWITSLGVGEILEKFGVSKQQIVELDWTQSVDIADGGCVITSLPARHFSGRSLFNRFETLWASFVIKAGDYSVYYGADSGWWEGFAEIGAAYGPFDLTMLEIGAFNELWKNIHMGPDGAARAYAALGGPERAGLLMPIHWGLFDLALHGWRQPIERLTEIVVEEKWPMFAPEPGLPTEIAPVQSDWWRM
jgi:L-ascorbate metabolism protein UlaG (beta-lactamase superfamily)